jgi:hypothetical protein
VNLKQTNKQTDKEKKTTHHFLAKNMTGRRRVKEFEGRK